MLVYQVDCNKMMKWSTHSINQCLISCVCSKVLLFVFSFVWFSRSISIFGNKWAIIRQEKEIFWKQRKYLANYQEQKPKIIVYFEWIVASIDHLFNNSAVFLHDTKKKVQRFTKMRVKMRWSRRQRWKKESITPFSRRMAFAFDSEWMSSFYVCTK